MTALLDTVRAYIEHEVDDLKGEEDFMPFMAYLTHDDKVIFAGLAAMGDTSERNGLASSMTGMLAVYRATEAAFATCAWMVDAVSREELHGLMPSEHPDRQEKAFILHVDHLGHDHFHSAKIHRINNKVALGAWEQDDDLVGVSGRFGDAIHLGIELGTKLPPAMVEFIDAHIEDDPQRLIQGFSEVLNGFTGGAPMDLEFFKVDQ